MRTIQYQMPLIYHTGCRIWEAGSSGQIRFRAIGVEGREEEKEEEEEEEEEGEVGEVKGRE